MDISDDQIREQFLNVFGVRHDDVSIEGDQIDVFLRDVYEGTSLRVASEINRMTQVRVADADARGNITISTSEAFSREDLVSVLNGGIGTIHAVIGLVDDEACSFG